MTKIYNLILRKFQTIKAGFQKLAAAYSFQYSYALVFLPSASKTESYKHALAEIKRLLEAGYTVQVVQEQDKKICERCLKEMTPDGVLLENQKDSMTSTEHV